MFSEWYLKFIKRKFFAKILLANIIIIITTVAGVVILVSNSISREIKSEQLAFNTQILETVNNYMENKSHVVKQMIQQIYLDSASYDYLFDLLNPIDTESYEFSEKKNKMDAFLYSNYIRDKDITNIAIYSNINDKTFFYSSNQWNISYENSFEGMKWFADFQKDPYGIKISSAYKPNFEKNRWIFSLGAYLKSKEFTANNGVLLVNFNADAIQNAYKQYSDKVKGIIYIFNKDGKVIYDSSRQYSDKPKPYMEAILSSEINTLIYKDSIVNFIKNRDGLFIVGVIENKELYNSVNSIKNTVYIIGLLCILISILLNYFSTSLLSKKINVIINAMKQIHYGDITNKNPIPISLKSSEDEIDQIAFRFNLMQENIASYIKEVYVAEIKYKNAAMIALQSQVNPHFLANTLESIRMKAITDGNEDVADMIFILSTLFRNVIKKANIVKIEEELAICEMYLRLFSYRYVNKFKVVFQVDEQIKDFLIGKLLLQPLAENSIIHGVDLSKDNNEIIITGTLQDQEIYITIEDNGHGIEPSQLEEIRQKIRMSNQDKDDGIGLINVNERIKLLYGESYGLEIFSIVGLGTKVILHLPAKSGSEVT